MVASPSFAHLVRETARRIPHPTSAGRTLWDARTDRGKFHGNISKEAVVQLTAETDTKITNNELSSIKPLGSGSDFTVFLQRIGVRFLHLFSDLTYIPPGCKLSYRVRFNTIRRCVSLPLGI